MSYVKVKSRTDSFKNELKLDEDYVWSGGTVRDGTRFQTMTAPFVGTSSVTLTTPDNWNYRQLIKEHKNATTPLEGGRYRIESLPDGIASAYWIAWDGRPSYLRNRPMFSEVSGTIPHYRAGPLTSASAIPNGQVDLEARMALLREIRQKRLSFEGGVFLGELGETLRMFRRPLNGVQRALREWIKSAKRKHSTKTPLALINRALAESWLEWAFGIKPLLSDLDDAQKNLERLLNLYESLYSRFQVTIDSKSNVGPWTQYSYVNATGWTFDNRWRRYQVDSIGYYGQVFLESQAGRTLALSNWGLTLENFVPTVYNLLPWTFVNDYFTNTGDLIEALTTYTGDVAWIAKRTKVSSVVEHWNTRAVFIPQSTVSSSIKGLHYSSSLTTPLVISYDKIARFALSGVPDVNPFQDFRIRAPNSGSLKYLNLAALVLSGKSTERLLSRGGSAPPIRNRRPKNRWEYDWSREARRE